MAQHCINSSSTVRSSVRVLHGPAVFMLIGQKLLTRAAYCVRRFLVCADPAYVGLLQQ